MSSSKGNIIPINEATREYGADAVRLYLASGVEPWQDFDWRVSEAKAMVGRLNRFYDLAQGAIEAPEVERPQLSPQDRSMLSRLQKHIQATTDALENFEAREAIQHAFFLMNQDLKWYLKRAREKKNRDWVLKKVIKTWARLLAPFTPHVCEELWHQMGEKGFVVMEEWPEMDEELIDEVAEFGEEHLKSASEDIRNILEVTGIEKPERICIYVAEDWKQDAYLKALDRVREGKVGLGELIEEAKEELPDIPPEKLANFFKSAIKELRRTPKKRVRTLAEEEVNEFQILSDAIDFTRKQFGVESVEVYEADDSDRYDPEDRAGQSIPFKPAIYVE